MKRLVSLSLIVLFSNSLFAMPYNNILFSAFHKENKEFEKNEQKNSDLHYFKARYYNANVGRFLSPDPHTLNPRNLTLTNPQTLNPYVYCINDPLTYVDPNGLWLDQANANAFISAATSKIGTPYELKIGSPNYPDKLDCTGLIRYSLGVVAGQSAKTDLFSSWNKISNPKEGGGMSNRILNAAKGGKYDLTIVSKDEMKAGDLIVAKGHAEIVSHVNEKTGEIKTLAASSGKKEVIERNPSDPWKEGHWWQEAFGQDPTVVRITEERIFYGPPKPEGW